MLVRGPRWSRFALLALPLLLFRDAVFHGRAFYERDIQLAWQPQVSVFVHCLFSGSWPVWDPFLGFGQPLLGDPSGQLLYPPTWLNLFMVPWTYYTVFVVAHALLGLAGVYVLSRRLGVSEPGAFVASVIWMLSGPTLSLVNLYHHFAGATWIPWVVVAADRAFRSGRWRDVAWLGLAFGAQLLAGSAEMAAASVILAALHAALSIVDWRTPLARSNRRLLGGAVLAGLLASGMAAAQWLPTAEVARRSQRQRLDESERTLWSVHPVAGVETILPMSLGALPLRADRRVAFFDGREPFLLSIYLGMPAVGLITAAAVVGRQRRLAVTCTLGALLLAFGRHTPVYAIASTAVPFLGSFRYPAKAMAVVALGWALMAGIGFDAWRARAPHPAVRWRWILGVTIAAVLLGATVLALVYFAPARLSALLFHEPDPYGRPPSEILRAPALDLSVGVIATVLVAGLMAVRILRPRRAGVVATAVALLAMGELFWVHRAENPTAPRELLAYRPPVLADMRQDDGRRLYVYDYAGFEAKAEQHLGRASPYTLARVPPGQTRGLAQALALRLYPLPPQPAIWGLYGSFELDGRRLYPPYLADLTGFLRVTEGTAEHLRLLRLGAVREVVALHERGFEDLTPVATFESLFPEPIRLFRVPDPLPRAYVVGGSRAADGRFALERVLVDPAFDPEREVVLADGAPTAPPAGFTGRARILELRPDRMRVEVTTSHDGWLVLVDAYDPGWRATLDGRPVPVLRANYAFRAVRAPAGTHVIEQVYRPHSVWAGLALSASALAAASLILIRDRG